MSTIAVWVCLLLHLRFYRLVWTKLKASLIPLFSCLYFLLIHLSLKIDSVSKLPFFPSCFRLCLALVSNLSPPISPGWLNLLLPPNRSPLPVLIQDLCKAHNVNISGVYVQHHTEVSHKISPGKEGRSKMTCAP